MLIFDQKTRHKIKKSLKVISGFISIILVSVIFVSNVNAATQWVDNPVSCNVSDASNFPGQNCAPTNICGDDSGISQCYDTPTLAPPAGAATSNTQYSASYPNGGYIVNCYATIDAAAPYCDNSGAFWCNRNNTCYNTEHRDTTCTGGSWGAASCGSCRSGFEDCDLGGDACEIQFGVTNYPSGSNNNYLNCSTAQCDSGWNDCDAGGIDVGNGCEIQEGSSCTVGSLTGTWNGCTCEVAKQYFETGTEANYGTSDPLLWGVQHGTGDLIHFGNATNNDLFMVNNDGAVQLGQISAPATTTDRLYNVGGSLYWNGALLGAGGGGDSIWDADLDTGIQVEETADDDIFRIDTFGTEKFTINGAGDLHWMDGGYQNAYFNIDNPSNLAGSDPTMAGLAFDSVNDRTWLMGGEVNVAQHLSVGTTNRDGVVHFRNPGLGSTDIVIEANGAANDAILNFYAGDGGLSTAGAVRWYASADEFAFETGGFNATTDMVFKTNLTERMRIADSGNVGIANTNPHALLDIGEGVISTPSGDYSILLSGDGYDSFLETRSTDMAEGMIMHGTGLSDSGVIRNIASSGYASGWTKGLHIFNANTDPIIFDVNGNELVTINNSSGYAFEVKDSTGNRIIAPGITYDSNVSGTENQNIGLGDVDGADNGTWLGIDTGSTAFGFHEGNVHLFNRGAATSNLNFQELSANGINYVGLTAPDSVISNVTWKLPNADGANGEALTTDGSGNLSWASASGLWTTGTTGLDTYLKPITYNEIAFGDGSDRGKLYGDSGSVTLASDVTTIYGNSGTVFTGGGVRVATGLWLDTQNNYNSARLNSNNLTVSRIFEFPDYAGDVVVTDNSAASNGDILSWNGSQWVAGSEAITLQGAADNSIAADGYVHADFGASFFEDDGGTAYFGVPTGGKEIGLQDDSNGGGFYFRSDSAVGADDGSIYLRDGRVTKKGLEYSGDYSADFTDRSLVDKEYVDLRLGLFESKLTDTAIGEAATSPNQYARSFVVGSPQLDDDGDTAHDARMLFDKTTGAFRVGQAQGTEWNSANRGANSFATGSNNTISGTNSFAAGQYNTTAASNVFLTGDHNTATRNTSTVIGRYNNASGSNSTAIGSYVNVHDYGEVGFGINSLQGTGSASSLLATNQIFHIGNGLNTSNRSNAMTVLFGGEVGFGTVSPKTVLHVDTNDVNTTAISTFENTAGHFQLFRVDATPESVVTGSVGDLAVDSTNGALYIKETGNGTNSGWLALGSGGDSIWDADTDTGIQVEKSADEDYLRFDTAGAERFIVDNNGNIGIDQSVPEARLHLGNSGSGSVADYNYLTLEGSGDVEHNIYSPTGSNLMIWNFNGTGNGGALRFANDVDAITDISNKGLIVNPSSLGGVSLFANGYLREAAIFNRDGDDGTLISLQQDGTEEGTISVSGNTVSYNAFTGSHYVWTDKYIEKGLLVEMTGENKKLHNKEDSEILYGVEVSAEKNSSKILGSYLAKLEPSEKSSIDNPSLVMAEGNGDIWLVDTGEDIKAGDYLISSDVPGHAQKLDNSFAVNYVVARAGESVKWDDVQGKIEGKKHKKISVFFSDLVINTDTVDYIKSEEDDGEKLLVEEIQTKKSKLSKISSSSSAMQVGQAVVDKRRSSGSVKFKSSFEKAPIVMLTLASDSNLMRYYVSDVTTDGFRVNIYPTQMKDVYLNWQAFPSNDDVMTTTIKEKEIKDIEVPVIIPKPIVIIPQEEEEEVVEDVVVVEEEIIEDEFDNEEEIINEELVEEEEEEDIIEDEEGLEEDYTIEDAEEDLELDVAPEINEEEDNENVLFVEDENIEEEIIDEEIVEEEEIIIESEEEEIVEKEVELIDENIEEESDAAVEENPNVLFIEEEIDNEGDAAVEEQVLRLFKNLDNDVAILK